MRFVIFSGGDFIPTPLTKKILLQADKVIAADSGADTAVHIGIIPSAIVGDMDSISHKTKAKLREKIVPQVSTLVSVPRGHSGPLNASEKDQTDTQLAIHYAIQQGATDITILGAAAGDRLDHVIANLLLATTYTIDIRFAQGKQLSWMAKGPRREIVTGTKGDMLSLLPFSQVVRDITTEGLYYPLMNESLYFGQPRGVSNVLTESKAVVSFTEGLLFFVHTATHEQVG